MSAYDRLLRHLPALDAALRAAVADGPDELVAASRYVLGWEDEHGAPAAAGGKRLRPLIAMEVAAACAGDPSPALPGAVAVELIHNFSLVHDDIQDRDVLRHGRPTAWQVIGEAQAINLGNFLYTRGLATLAAARTPGAVLALGMLFEAVERMVAGQWADIAFERAETISEDDYLRMVEGKTGALLGAAAGVGAALAGAPPPTVEALRRWGVVLGIAFQVRDDYLGTWGDSEATGKSTSSDISRRKKTLPVVFGLNSPVQQQLRALYAPDAGSAVQTTEVVALLTAAGAREHTLDVAHTYATRAETLLEATGLPAERTQGLRAIGRFFVERDR